VYVKVHYLPLEYKSLIASRTGFKKVDIVGFPADRHMPTSSIFFLRNLKEMHNELKHKCNIMQSKFMSNVKLGHTSIASAVH